MDYNWLTSGDHDPITIDANLAEIDFDDFKNEDIQNAYAFSLQSYVSTTSICTNLTSYLTLDHINPQYLIKIGILI